MKEAKAGRHKMELLSHPRCEGLTNEFMEMSWAWELLSSINIFSCPKALGTLFLLLFYNIFPFVQDHGKTQISLV